MEGDQESETIINSMMIVDNKNPSFNLDFTKFLSTFTGGGGPVHAPGGVGAAIIQP